MDVAIYHVGFPYLGITLRRSLRAQPGRNTTKALRNIEHVRKSGLCVGFV